MKRDNFTLPLGLLDELLIDSFAGGGGASEGIEQAFGRSVDVAVNHDGEALAMHVANHPGTAHYEEDVFTVHPGFVTKQQPIGLAWFSPDCKHHSRAKGGKPVERKIRGLAWVTLKWGTFQMPRAIALENVTEFQDWGPLDDAGKPIKAEKGRTFRAFVDALTTGLSPDHPDVPEIFEALGADFPMHRLYSGLGYKLEYRVLHACDYGTPTIRKRLFVFARRDGLPICWPEPTHGNPKLPGFKASGLQPWRTAAECIDWSIKCPSIFERKTPLKEATLRRIAKGIMRYVINAQEPFIVNLTHGGRLANTNDPMATVTGAHRGEKALVSPTLIQVGYGEKAGQEPRALDIEKPLGTIVGSGKHAVISAFLTEHANASNQRNFDVDEPLRTQCAQVKGGHFGLVTAFLAKHYGGVVGTGVDVPTGTVTSVDHHSIVTSHLVKLRNNQHGQSVDEPMPTLTAGGGHVGEVRAFLIKYYGTDQDPRLDEPLHTVTTKDRYGLVTIKGIDYAIVDIGMRMLTPRELARAQGFPDSYILDPIYKGKPLSKTAQVRMIGNSVCPPLARALIEANFKHEREIARVA